MHNKILFLGYDKHDNLLFKVKKHRALFVIDFKNDSVRLLRGYLPKSKKKKLRKYLLEHHDLKF